MWSGGEKTTQAGIDSESVTFLAKGAEFKGIVRFDGTIPIDGRVEGEIYATGKVIIGEYAVIKDVVSAGAVVNSGKMNATITARETIQLSKTGILIGDIRTPSIGIEDGAHFHGMCDMGAHKWDEEQPSVNQALNQAVGYRGRIRAPGY